MGRETSVQRKLHLLKQHSLHLRRKTYLQRELYLFEQYIVHYRRYDTRSDTADDIVGATERMPIHLTFTRHPPVFAMPSATTCSIIIYYLIVSKHRLT